MKSFAIVLLAGLLIAPGCKKKKKEETPAAKTAETTPAKPDEVKPEPVAEPMLALDGSPAENMTAVYKAGLAAISAGTPAEAAAKLTAFIGKYDIADLKAKASAAKKEGKGATAEQIKVFKALEADFKKRAEELGKADAAAFGAAAEAWTKAWS